MTEVLIISDSTPWTDGNINGFNVHLGNLDLVPTKTAGAYKIANHLRTNGFTCKVIDNFSYLLYNDARAFIEKVTSYITEETFLIGFSCTFFYPTPKIEKAIRIFIASAKKKNKNVKFVAGGNSRNPKLFYENFQLDYRIDGLAENSILELCSNLKNKTETKPIYIDLPAHGYNFHEAAPAFSHEDIILPNEVLPIEISRGCRFKCKFCSFFLLGRDPKADKYIRSRYSLAKEFENNYKNFGTTDYIFVCDTFNESIDKLKVVKQAIDDVGIKLNFGCYNRIDLLYHHREQVDLLLEMGIKSVFMGIESLYTPSAKAVGKGLTSEKVIEMLDYLDDHWGDQVLKHGNFIIGLPYDTEETIEKWMKLILDGTVKLDSIQVNALLMGKASDRVWSSEFERNPEVYGYEIYQDNNNIYQWKSPTMTSYDAIRIQNYWQDKIDQELDNKIDPFVAIGMKNLGYSYDEIFKIIRKAVYNDKMLQDDIVNRIKNWRGRWENAFYEKI